MFETLEIRQAARQLITYLRERREIERITSLLEKGEPLSTGDMIEALRLREQIEGRRSRRVERLKGGKAIGNNL